MYPSKELGELDHFFAKRVLRDRYSEESSLFLSTLMHVSRQGEICWIPDERFQKIGAELPSTVVQEGGDTLPLSPVVRDENRYYLQRNWVYESLLIQSIKRLREQKNTSNHEKEIFHNQLRILVEEGKLLPSQGKALEEAFEHSFSLICGGPGTGKTYTAGFLVRLLFDSLKKERYKVVLAAPTGKAASNLETALLKQGEVPPNLEIETTTIHRLLRIKPGESHLFSGRRVDADLVLIDEASMVDVPLLAQLFEAIGSETRLVLMGDPDQLPPVEAGSFFAEMASHFSLPLKKSMRTEIPHLQELAESINQGKVPKFDDPSVQRLCWKFDSQLYMKLYGEINPAISNDQLSPDHCLKQSDRLRVLSALRQGPFGTDEMNLQIIEEMGRRVRVGQWWSIPIMVKVNEPSLDLYNGSCGVLIGRSQGGIHLKDGVAYFPGKEPLFSPPPFEVAFCLSIHKSQGSEFEHVLALFPYGSENFGRESLYTAVTRAKRGIKLLADDQVLEQMLVKQSRRTSGFTARLQKALYL